MNQRGGHTTVLRLTVVIAPTMVIMTPAIAEMMALIPEPIAENIEPYVQAMLTVSKGK
jgi:hypothetical protein